MILVLDLSSLLSSILYGMNDFIYSSYKETLEQRYGEALYRVPIDLGLGCPNREKGGSGGCTFCPENGARAVQILDLDDTKEQIEAGISFAKRRYKAQQFMLYIQAYTGTLLSVIEQKKQYAELLAAYPFKAFCIGTRPDCLSTATLDYLEELNKSIDVIVELGVQSIHDRSLELINRQHNWASSKQAILELNRRGIQVCAHVIVGLPGETEEDFLATAEALAALPIDGIKIHNLHVIEGTELARQYMRKPFPLLSEYQYLDILIAMIRRLPRKISLMRFVTDTEEQELLAPKWQMTKAPFYALFRKHMRYRGYEQGDLCEGEKAHKLSNSIQRKDFKGRRNYRDQQWRDFYYPRPGASYSFEKTFAEGAQLESRFALGDQKLLDIAFGSGMNSFLTLKKARKMGRKVFVDAIDLQRSALPFWAEESDCLESREILMELYKKGQSKLSDGEINYHDGDARYICSNLKEKYDLIYLDAFSPRVNAELYTVDFLLVLKDLLKADGVLVISKSSSNLLVALKEAGLKQSWNLKGLKELYACSAKLTGEDLYDESLLKGKLAFRDPQLLDSSRKIRAENSYLELAKTATTSS